MVGGEDEDEVGVGGCGCGGGGVDKPQAGLHLLPG